MAQRLPSSSLDVATYDREAYVECLRRTQLKEEEQEDNVFDGQVGEGGANGGSRSVVRRTREHSGSDGSGATAAAIATPKPMQVEEKNFGWGKES